MAIKAFLMYIWFIICVQSIAIASLLGRMLTFGFIHYGLNELCRFVAMVTGLKLFAKKGKLYTAGPVFYFFNHRSWTDFYLDPITVTGCKHISMLSRMFVYWGIPFPSIVMNLGQNLLFFRRGGSSQDELNAQLDRHFERYPECGMVVYPEGTRNPEKKEMVLKTGMMRVAYRMQLPVQIIMTSNKERVMREKPMYAAERNIDCETVFGAVLKPQDFNSAEEFIAAIKHAWQQTQTDLDTPADKSLRRRIPVWQVSLTGKAVFAALMAIFAFVLFCFKPSKMIAVAGLIIALYFVKLYRDSFAGVRSPIKLTKNAK